MKQYPPPPFALTLFGGFQLRDAAGQVFDPGPSKAKALLAWLAIRPDCQHPREELASLLWPDSEPAQARHSLRQALASLRKIFVNSSGPLQSAKQWVALDLLAELADEHCVESVFEPGDIQFLNNHVIYHARRPFIDDEESGYKRNLMRIWLCPPGNRVLPEDHAPLWRTVEADSLRGGVALEPAS